MNWKTIYLKGKGEFKEEVLKKLEQSNLKFMPGYMEGAGNYDLYWLDEAHTLRDFKKAITGKLIWKYRLRFFDTLEAFIESNHAPQTSGPTMDEKPWLVETAK